MKNPSTYLLGIQGEDLVAQHLQNQGHQIIAKRWQCPWSDLDLVARDRTHLIFIEVKTRSSNNWDQDGLLALSPRKQTRLSQAANHFLGTYDPEYNQLPCRFDVALVRHQAGRLWLHSYIPNALCSFS